MPFLAEIEIFAILVMNCFLNVVVMEVTNPLDASYLKEDSDPWKVVSEESADVALEIDGVGKADGLLFWNHLAFVDLW